MRYADESSSPATESLPLTPVNGATFVEVIPTSGGFGLYPSPKYRKTGSLGQIIFNFGGSKKKKEKQKGRPETTIKAYYGSSVPMTTTDTTIASHVSACLQSFDHLSYFMHDAENEYLDQVQPCEIADELGRFRIWAGSMGAYSRGRPSLDYRLRDASHIKRQAQTLLTDLDDSLQRTLQILRGDCIPWDRQMVPADEEMAIESDDESLEGDSELRQLLTSIHETITFLLRLSAAIQNPAPHDHYMHSTRFRTSQASENSDIGHVQEMFPIAPKTVVEVLGRAISRRREYFIYRAVHNKKPSKGIQEENIHSEPKSGDGDGKPMLNPLSKVASSISETLKPSAHYLELEEEQLSECDSIQTSLDSAGLGFQAEEIPPLPKRAQSGDPFPCPFCFMVISVESLRSWKLHVLEDLQPYVCTFPSCLSSKNLFERCHEWFQHEMQHHRRVWTCASGCQAFFESREDFEQHLQQSHGYSEKQEQLKSLVDSCEMRARPDFETNCILCGDSLKMEHLERHLGKHQEHLALFALPDISTSDINEVEDSSAGMTTSEVTNTTASEDCTSNTSFDDYNTSSGDESEGSTKATSSSGQSYSRRRYKRSYSRDRFDYPSVRMAREHKKPPLRNRPILRGYQSQQGGYEVDAEGYYKNSDYDTVEQRRLDPGEEYRQHRAPHPALADRRQREYSPPSQYHERLRSKERMKLPPAPELMGAFEEPRRRADVIRRLEEEELHEREPAAQADLDLYLRKQRARTSEGVGGEPGRRNEAEATRSMTKEEFLQRKAAKKKDLENSLSNDAMKQHRFDPGEENR